MHTRTNQNFSRARVAEAARAALRNPLAVTVATLGTVTVLALADAAIASLRASGAWSGNAALTVLAFGGAAAGLVAPALALLAFVLLWALARVPRVTSAVLLLGAALAIARVASAIRLQRIQWDAVDLWLPTGVVGALAWQVCTTAYLVPARRAVALTVAGSVLTFAGCATGLYLTAGAEARGDTLAAIDQGSVFLSPLVQRASRVLDRDGDGHPSWLCGQACDCDDARAQIHPLAREVADNGVDEDCDGRDASAAELAARESTLGMRRPAPPPAKALPVARPPDVLLIIVDTLRPDHLGLYGYGRTTSPRIDALGERAVVFEQARAAGPSTRFSMPAMLTGKWFTEIDRNRYEWPAISERELLLGERLRELGYTLAAFHSIRYFRPYFHLGQGFHHWSDRALDERTPELLMTSSDYITDEVLAWLDAHPRVDDPGAARSPLFLWAYYGDPHAEYMRHSGFPRFGPTSIDRYDGEIAFADHHVGRLLDGIEDRGLSDDLIVVLASDHGEALDKAADHGVLNHSKNLYDELIRVPLLVVGPAFPPHRVATPVSLIDLLPTFLELAGAPIPDELRGVSLLPWLRSGTGRELAEPAHPPVFFEKHRAIDDPQKGMVAWPYKVITTVSTGHMQIYDLGSDPRECDDLYDSMAPEERGRLTGMLQHWASQVLRPARNDFRH